MGIRKRPRTKKQISRRRERQYREKPSWNDDTTIGGDPVNSEKAFRLRSLNQKTSERENKRQAAIKRAIIEFERRGWEESKGGLNSRMGTADGFGSNVALMANFKPVGALHLAENAKVYDDLAKRKASDPVIRKSYTDRSDGYVQRTHTKQQQQQ